MITIREKNYEYAVECLGVPPFPAYLTPQLEVAQEHARPEDKQFLDWWIEQLVMRGWVHGKMPIAEEWVHVRRLLLKHSPRQLQHYAGEFLMEYADPKAKGVYLMRHLAHTIPVMEAADGR